MTWPVCLYLGLIKKFAIKRLIKEFSTILVHKDLYIKYLKLNNTLILHISKRQRLSKQRCVYTLHTNIFKHTHLSGWGYGIRRALGEHDGWRDSLKKGRREKISRIKWLREGTLKRFTFMNEGWRWERRKDERHVLECVWRSGTLRVRWSDLTHFYELDICNLSAHDNKGERFDLNWIAERETCNGPSNNIIEIRVGERERSSCNSLLHCHWNSFLLVLECT